MLIIKLKNKVYQNGHKQHGYTSKTAKNSMFCQICNVQFYQHIASSILLSTQ